MKGYPKDLPPVYNGSGTPCDMLEGACQCGAWHNEQEQRNKTMSVSEMAREEEWDDDDDSPRIPENRKLVLVNGPPRSGKDTVGELIRQFYPGLVYVTKFAKPLKEMTHALYGLMRDGKPLPHDHFESQKDVVLPEFLGITPRQAYIGMAERYMKPMHGHAIFGHLLKQDIEQNAGSAEMVVVTDSGFPEEATLPITLFERENITLLRMERPGRDYSGDSRGKLYLPGITTFDIKNDLERHDLLLRLSDIIGLMPRYQIEVELPVGSGLEWFQLKGARVTLPAAQAAAESLRQHASEEKNLEQGPYHGKRLRITFGQNVFQTVEPTDPPLLDIG